MMPACPCDDEATRAASRPGEARCRHAELLDLRQSPHMGDFGETARSAT